MVRSSLGYHPGDRPVPKQGYELLVLLGVGQFGEVWKARAPGGFEIALKLIDLTRREGEREFAALRQLRQIRNPHLTPITASWILDENGQLIEEAPSMADIDDGGSDAFPSENHGDYDSLLVRQQPARLIVGMGLGDKCLNTRLKECKAKALPGIPLEELLEYMAGAAKGLDYLHKPIHEMGQGLAPIVHRDIKPHNILVVGGEAQVCDFGLARAMPNLVASRTKTAVGTLAYMGPEVAQYRQATARSDQYSFAVTYFELRTGKLPFGDCEDPNVVDVVRAHESGKLNLHLLSRSERRVVAKATDKNPAKRYATCSQFVAALRIATQEERPRSGLLSKLFGSSKRPGEAPPHEHADGYFDSAGEQSGELEETSALDRDRGRERVQPEPSEQPAASDSTSGGRTPGTDPTISPEVEPAPATDVVLLKEQTDARRDDATEPVSVVETLSRDARPPRPPPDVESPRASGAAAGGTMVVPSGAPAGTTDEPPSSAPPPQPLPEPREEARPRRRRRRVLLGTALLATALAAAALVVAERDRLPQPYRAPADRIAERITDAFGFSAATEENDEKREQEKEDEREEKTDPIVDESEVSPPPPDYEREVRILVTNRDFDGAMQVVAQAPTEEQAELRGTVRNAWRQHMRVEWDANRIQNVADHCEQYLDRFPAPEAPSSAQVWLLLADCQMRLWPANWDEKVLNILRRVQQFEDDEEGFLSRAKARWKMELIQLRFDIVGPQTPNLDERFGLFARHDAVKKKYLAEEEAADIVSAGADPPELDSLRRQIIAQAVQSVNLAWNHLDNGRLEDARELLGIIEPIVRESSDAVHLAPLRAVLALHDGEALPESVNTALDELAKYVAGGCEDRIRVVIAAALRELAERKDAPLLETQLGQAIDIVRVKLLPGTAPPLAHLWERRVRIWLGRDSSPAGDELAKLKSDAAWLKQEGTGSRLLDLAVAYWQKDEDKVARTLDVSAEDLPEELALFADYLRLRAVAEGLKPDWNAMIELSTGLFTNPLAAEVLHLHGRLDRAAAVTVRACTSQRRPEMGLPPEYPYLKSPMATAHAAVLTPILRLALSEEDVQRELKVGLMLAIASRSQPDWQWVWTTSQELIADLPAARLTADYAAVCDVCVRSYLKLPEAAQRNAAASGAALTAALRLLDDVTDRGGLADDTAVASYAALFEPLREKLVPFRTLAKEGQPSGVAIEDLERYHAAMGGFIELHRFTPFTEQAADHEKENAKLREELFHWALYLHSKTPKQNPKTLACYYVQRGHARAGLTEPDLPGALQDAKTALSLQANLARAHGLICHALLVRSREQVNLESKREDLDGAILAGMEARKAGGDLDAATKAVLLLNLSYAHLERANFLRDPTFQRHKKDLQEALAFAKEADKIPQRYPEYPLIALGHAYEDLAWIVEAEPEENYRTAVEAFRQADRRMILGAGPKLGIARTLYKAVCHTQLDPRRLGFEKKEDVYTEVRNLLNQCVETEKKTGTPDPTVPLYLGNVAQVQKQFDAVDRHFEEAWRVAKEEASPSRATFAVQWAAFPLSNASLKPQDRHAEALRRAAALEREARAGGLPAAPGGKPDPAKEAALIRARVAQANKDRTAALDQLNKALPASAANAEWSDLGLLLLRAEIRGTAALEDKDKPPVWEDARSALVDVNRAVDVAVTRFDLIAACRQAFVLHNNVYSAMDRLPAAPQELPAPDRLVAQAGEHLERWSALARPSEEMSDSCESMAFMKSQEAKKTRPPGNASAAVRVQHLEKQLRLWKAAQRWMEQARDLTADSEKKNRRSKSVETLAEITKRVEADLGNARKQQDPPPEA